MIRVFRQEGSEHRDDTLWSFSYVDWQGKPQVGVGTESRIETQKLAQRVQAEHDLLRKKMRPAPVSRKTPSAPQPGPNGSPRVQPSTPELDSRSMSEPDEALVLSDLIGEQMVAAHVVTRDHLDEALAHQEAHGGKIVDILIRLGHLTADKFLVFMGRRPGIPRIVLENYHDIPEEVLELVPREMCLEHELVPIDRMGRVITIAMVCPVDRTAIKAVQEETRLKVRPVLCSWVEFREALWRHYGIMAKRKFQKPRQ